MRMEDIISELVSGVAEELRKKKQEEQATYRRWVQENYPEAGVQDDDSMTLVHIRTSLWMAEDRYSVVRFNAELQEPKSAGNLVRAYIQVPDEFHTDTIEDHVNQGFKDESVLDLKTLFEAFCDAEFRMVQKMLPETKAMLATELQRKAERTAQQSRKAPPPSDLHYISVN